MKTTKIYKYIQGYATMITCKRPNRAGYKTYTRITADDGKILVNSVYRLKVVDTTKPQEWVEEDE